MPDWTMGFNKARNDEIVALHGSGLSYSQVAERMGLTRNTVVGVVGRNRGRDFHAKTKGRTDA